MRVKELIVKLLDLPLDADILVEVNGQEEYEINDAVEIGVIGFNGRAFIQIDGVPVEGEE